MSHSHIGKTFLQSRTLCNALGICCPFALARLESTASKTAEAVGLSTRTIQRLRLKILRGELRCEKTKCCLLIPREPY